MISAKALTHEVEGSHVNIGVDVARKYKENQNILHAIEAHHGDVEPRTIVACLVQAADAISAARPVRGVRMWKIISNACKSWRKLPILSRVWKNAMPFRQGGKSVSW